jgi:hypothetical protein
LDCPIYARRTWAPRSAHAPIYTGLARPTTGMSTAAGDAAVEMPLLWKSQNDFHRSLGISHRTGDSHIPTADPLLLLIQKKKSNRKVLPMYPV